MPDLAWAALEAMSVNGTTSDTPNWNALALDVRLRAANHIVELSWRERKIWWTRQDIVCVFVDVLHELVAVPIDQLPLGDVKELLRHVYLGASDVIPPEFRDF